MGVSRANVQRLAQGHENSTLVSLCKLAAALDCELEIKLTPKAPAEIEPAAARPVAAVPEAAKSAKRKPKG